MRALWFPLLLTVDKEELSALDSIFAVLSTSSCNFNCNFEFERDFCQPFALSLTAGFAKFEMFFSNALWNESMSQVSVCRLELVGRKGERRKKKDERGRGQKSVQKGAAAD